MIETKDHLEMKAGQSRTVQITVNPRQVSNSVVRVFRKQLISLEGNSLSDLQGGPEKMRLFKNLYFPEKITRKSEEKSGHFENAFYSKNL